MSNVITDMGIGIPTGLSKVDKQRLVDITNNADSNNDSIKTSMISHVNNKAKTSLPNNSTWKNIENTIDGISELDISSNSSIAGITLKLDKIYPFNMNNTYFINNYIIYNNILAIFKYSESTDGIFIFDFNNKSSKYISTKNDEYNDDNNEYKIVYFDNSIIKVKEINFYDDLSYEIKYHDLINSTVKTIYLNYSTLSDLINSDNYEIINMVCTSDYNYALYSIGTSILLVCYDNQGNYIYYKKFTMSYTNINMYYFNNNIYIISYIGSASGIDLLVLNPNNGNQINHITTTTDPQCYEIIKVVENKIYYTSYLNTSFSIYDINNNSIISTINIPSEYKDYFYRYHSNPYCIDSNNDILYIYLFDTSKILTILEGTNISVDSYTPVQYKYGIAAINLKNGNQLFINPYSFDIIINLYGIINNKLILDYNIGNSTVSDQGLCQIDLTALNNSNLLK